MVNRMEPIKLRDGSTAYMQTFKFESKEDRIRKHLAEFETHELEEMLMQGKTMYGPESALDTETDICEEMRTEIEERHAQSLLEAERATNPEWGTF